jgi:hypothetical protein
MYELKCAKWKKGWKTGDARRLTIRGHHQTLGLHLNPIQQEAFSVIMAAKNIFAFVGIFCLIEILFQPVETDS